MEDKLHTFFSENEFDFHEPHAGHMKRFETDYKAKKLIETLLGNG